MKDPKVEGESDREALQRALKAVQEVAEKLEKAEREALQAQQSFNTFGQAVAPITPEEDDKKE